MQPSAKTILMADIGIVWVIIVAVVILYRVASRAGCSEPRQGPWLDHPGR